MFPCKSNPSRGLSALFDVAHHSPVLLHSVLSLTVDFVKYFNYWGVPANR